METASCGPRQRESRGGGEGGLSAGAKEGGDVEPPRGRTTETEMHRYRLSDAAQSATWGLAEKQREHLRPQATAEVDAEKLPLADHEGRGQKTVKGAGV